GLGRLHGDVGLLDVVGSRRVGSVQEGVRSTEEKVHMGTDRVGVVVQGQLGGLQAELVGLIVEVIELVDLAIGGGLTGAVGVIAVVPVDITAEVYRSDAPHRRRSRGRCG